MKIWRLSEPLDQGFARASRIGTWSSEDSACQVCGDSGEKRIEPLVIEWEPGSDVIGDFVWPGFGSDIAVTERVVRFLDEGGYSEYRLGSVEMIQDPNLDKRKNSRPRIWLPCEGVRLYDLIVDFYVAVDLDVSSVEIENSCAACGRQRFSVSGIEEWRVDWDRECLERVDIHVSRKKGAGIFIRRDELKDVCLFRVREFPSFVLCTDSFMQDVLSRGLKNIQFLEAGNII